MGDHGNVPRSQTPGFHGHSIETRNHAPFFVFLRFLPLFGGGGILRSGSTMLDCTRKL